MAEIANPKTQEEINRERQKEWDRQKSKKWYQEHKAEKKEYCKEHYAENRKSILEKGAEKVMCDLCGSLVCRKWISGHKKSFKCKAISEKKNEII